MCASCAVVFALVAVVLAAAYHFLKNRNLPPGPIGLPFIGYWPFFRDKTCGEHSEALRKKYGDVFSFTSAGRLYVNLSTIKLLREAHVSKADCFADRFTDFNLMAYVFKDGVGFLNGEPWSVLRKFFQQVMRDRGLMSIRDVTSGVMYESVQAAVDDLRRRDGEPVNLIESLSGRCITILRATLFGEGGITDEQIGEINQLYGIMMTSLTPTNLLLTGTIARYLIFPFMPSFHVAMKCHEQIKSLLYGIIDEHKTTYDENHLRDVIDDFFKERDLRRRKGDPTACHFTDKALMSTLEQVVGDGVISVAGFICLAVKALVDHPHEQQKVHDEIVEVVGENRQPTVDDKNKLHYTNAFILEALRTSEFFPFVPVLECTKETTLRGYRIPKGSISVMNIYTAHFDWEEFEDPRKFNPSRYIKTEGKRRPEIPISFGIGKRACIGEAFAMTQVFLFLTTIVKNFTVTASGESSTNTFEDYMEGKLKVVATPRN